MRRSTWIVMFLILAGARISLGATEILKNADFTAIDAWGGFGSDDNKDVSVIDLRDGIKGVKLVRKAAGAQVRIDQTVKLKPQTLYKFVVTGHGDAKAAVRLRPQSSDKEYDTHIKPWATSSAPMAAAADKNKLVTSEFIFDSGKKANQVIVMLYLDGKEPGEYIIDSVSLTEIGTSKPAADEKIVLHLGDSFTITSYLPFEQRVEKLLADQLAKEAPTLKVRQINYGADGEFLKDLLNGRYKKIIKENLERVDVAFIRYGANDRNKGSVEEFTRKLNELCDMLEKDYPGVKIVLCTGTSIKGATDINKKYEPFWQASRDLAVERKLPVADISKAFADSPDGEKLTKSKGDMHPSPEGVKVTAETEWKVLKEILGVK